MNSSKFRLTLNLHSIQSQHSIPAMLGDTYITLLISISDGGVPYTIAEGCLAKLSIKRPSGSHLEEFCKITNNSIIEYPFKQNINTCAEAGIHFCDVTLYSPDGEVLGTPSFIMVVSEKVVRRDDIDLSTDDYTAVNAMMAQEATRQAEETKRAEAEVARSEAEDERVKAENERVEAENERAEAMKEITSGKLYIPDRSIVREKIAMGAVFEEHFSNNLKLDLYRSRWNVNKIMAHDKRLTNLERGYSDDLFRTDSTTAFQKTVPANALPYAEIESVDEAVTKIKSLGGNKVLSSEAVLTPSFRSMTVTDLGGGKFQFDGYTSWQDGDYNFETKEFNKHAFWSFPLKAGTYKFSTSSETGNTDDTGTGVEFALIANGTNYKPGYVTITEDAMVSLGVASATGGNGQSGYIGSFELFKYEGYENAVENHSEFISKPCDTLTIADLGSGNFQLDGYTGCQEWMPYTFLKMPIKAGTYSLNMSIIVEDKNYYDSNDAQFIIKVNGKETHFNSGTVMITEDTTAELIVHVGTIGNGAVGLVVNLSVINNSAITREVIDTLATPLGEDDNFIAVEPAGTLVFENEGKNAVASTVTYMLKGE